MSAADDPILDDAESGGPTVARGATELDAIIAAAEADGFFGVLSIPDEPTDDPTRASLDVLVCAACGEAASAGSFVRAWSRRLEGASDPADMMHVSALTCPHCGVGGVFISPFGPAASERESAVLQALPEPRVPAGDDAESQLGDVSSS